MSKSIEIHKYYVTGKVPHAYACKCAHSDYWNIIGYIDGGLKVLSGTNESEAAAWALAGDRLDDIAAQQALGEIFYIKPMVDDKVIDNKTREYNIARDGYINGYFDAMIYVNNFIDNSDVAMTKRQMAELITMSEVDFVEHKAAVFMSGLEWR